MVCNDSSASVEAATRERYAEAAGAVEPSLCCAVASYPPALLDAIPQEILQVDYGCGDPTRWIETGETVLDLGSGSGKICYIASQVVGERGRVIGVDFNPPMLALSRGAKAEFVRRAGFDNVEFRNGRIQDLALDLDALGSWLAENPVTGSEAFLQMNEHAQHLRRTRPLVETDSIDVIVSNCVLNLVQSGEKEQLFREMYRVLRSGGRCVISDIVSDEPVPARMQADPDLWSGCISGAYQEAAFLQAFERAGFHGMQIIERSETPWRVVKGIEFRSATVRAFKGEAGPCLDRNQAVVYRGPWRQVVDDDGHTLHRGERMAVCDKTFNVFTSAPYADAILPIPPRVEVPIDQAHPFDCEARAPRLSPARTKGADYLQTTDEEPCCGDGSCG